MNPLFGNFFNLGPMELMVIAVIGVLLFGRRLPEVGRYLGKGIVEFKKGMKGLEDGMDDTAATSHRPEALPSEAIRAPQRVQATAPKFEDTNISAPPRV